MMIAQSKTYLPYIQAAAEGKTIQHNNDNVGWKDLPAVATIECYSPESLRIKPEPKLRPWKPEEVPLGCWLRGIASGGRWLLTAALGNGAAMGTGGENNVWSYDSLLSQYEHSTDHGATWKPCGILE